MSPTDDDRRDGSNPEVADGGQSAAAALESVSDVELSREERLKNFYLEYVYAPFSIIWNDWRARIGLSLVSFYVLVGLFGPVFIDQPATMDGRRLMAPFESGENPLGTDGRGRNILGQLVYSTVPILKMMMAGAGFSVVLGTTFGTVSGYKGGTTDRVLSTIVDIFINIPGLPLIIVLAALVSPRNPYLVGILLAVAAWAGLARNIRSQVLTLREKSFVESSRIMGVRTDKIVVKHVLPNLMPYIAINFVNSARRIIFAAVGLYFIGVLPYTESNWGVMMSEAQSGGAMYRPDALHWLVLPMIAVIGICFGLILLAQSFDRVFNPRARAKHAGKDRQAEPEEDRGEVVSATDV